MESTRFQIRFNTESERVPGSTAPKWRVLANGEESLARHVVLEVPAWTSTDVLPTGIVKHHITCEGAAHWEGETLTIRPPLNH